MFNMFKRKDKQPLWSIPDPADYGVDREDAQPDPSTGYIVPQQKKTEGKVYYRFGLTDNNRVAFQIGINEITMNYEGCQQIIDQLKFYQSQLSVDSDEEGKEA